VAVRSAMLSLSAESFHLAMPLLKLSHVLQLEAGDKLLELHATEQGQQLLRESVQRLALLGQQAEDNSVYKVNEIDSRLDDMLLGLRQIPPGF
jgi:hypothetical protein